MAGNGEACRRGKGGGGEEHGVGHRSLWRRMKGESTMGEVAAWGGDSVLLLLPRVPCSRVAGPLAWGWGKRKGRRKKKRKEKIEKEEKMWKIFHTWNFFGEKMIIYEVGLKIIFFKKW
jgi:hypothetical protein